MHLNLIIHCIKSSISDLLSKTALNLTLGVFLEKSNFRNMYRDEIYPLYVVGLNFFLLLLNCSAWPLLDPA